MKLFLRLTADVNDGLRSFMKYRGDLSRFAEEALRGPDLMRVDVVWNGRSSQRYSDNATMAARTFS